AHSRQRDRCGFHHF
ncbi:glucose-1-phosphate adenylyltransferase, partial [Vibrio parahaemolyticus EKP-021]